MYFLVRESAPLGLAMVGVAHGACAAALRWAGEERFEIWQKTSFRKVICRVTDEQFLSYRNLEHPFKICITESSLKGMPTTLVLLVDEDEVSLKNLSLYT